MDALTESWDFTPTREYADLGPFGPEPVANTEYTVTPADDDRPHFYQDLDTGLLVVNREQYEYHLRQLENQRYEDSLSDDELQSI